MKEQTGESTSLDHTPTSHRRETGVDTDPIYYEIRVGGLLDDCWIEWFGGLTLIRREDRTTALAGPVADQAALYGLLERMRDLGLSLLSVNRLHHFRVLRRPGRPLQQHRCLAPLSHL
jgi:hypothetical protein